MLAILKPFRLQQRHQSFGTIFRKREALPQQYGHVILNVSFGSPRTLRNVKTRARDFKTVSANILSSQFVRQFFPDRGTRCTRFQDYFSQQFVLVHCKAIFSQKRYQVRSGSGTGAYAGAARRRVHLATVLLWPPSGHRPGRRQFSHALQIGLRLAIVQADAKPVMPISRKTYRLKNKGSCPFCS